MELNPCLPRLSENLLSLFAANKPEPGKAEAEERYARAAIRQQGGSRAIRTDAARERCNRNRTVRRQLGQRLSRNELEADDFRTLTGRSQCQEVRTVSGIH